MAEELFRLDGKMVTREVLRARLLEVAEEAEATADADIDYVRHRRG